MTNGVSLVDFITSQRWYGSKTRDVSEASVVDRASLRDNLELQLVEVVFDTGTHETYQLLTDQGGFDALGDEEQALELLRLVRAGETVAAQDGQVQFAQLAGHAGRGEPKEARLIVSEQSNTSVVFDEELILKVFRRLEAGINPELELLHFLTEAGFESIAQLAGWYAYSGLQMEATLGIAQHYIAGAEDGWERALDAIVAHDEVFLDTLRRLGEITGEMHTVLGANTADPNFCPEQTSAESLGLLTATVDEEIEQVFTMLPDDEPDLEPIRGRGEEVRERLRLLTNIGGAGRVIRNHGDFHLGQTLWAGGDWVLLDFEGEPARSLPERRRKRSPLRDVAGMLRSFAYAASAARVLRDVDAPPDWEERARAEFLDGYRQTVDLSLVPSGAAMDKLLRVFELEKAVYELSYELNNRPDWVRIPVAGIARMLDEEVPL
ncbi:MAG TPA: phosphotransferase [Gaiellaceae bacterium]|nr:phosphotransferase [Gaiellaceae bacterium]